MISHNLLDIIFFWFLTLAVLIIIKYFNLSNLSRGKLCVLIVFVNILIFGFCFRNDGALVLYKKNLDVPKPAWLDEPDTENSVLTEERKIMSNQNADPNEDRPSKSSTELNKLIIGPHLPRYYKNKKILQELYPGLLRYRSHNTNFNEISKNNAKSKRSQNFALFTIKK